MGKSSSPGGNGLALGMIQAILTPVTASARWRRIISLHSKNNSTTFTALIALPAAVAALGSWWLLKAIGNIKVGIKRRLGTQVHLLVDENNAERSNNVDDDTTVYRRRLGLLERWYVAHSRTRMHTGFVICLELEAKKKSKSNQATVPSFDEIREILFRLSETFPWLRVKVKRDGVVGIDSGNSPQGNKKTESSSVRKVEIWGDDLYLEVMNTKQASRRGKEDAVFSLREVILPTDMEPLEGLRNILEEEGAKEWHDDDPDAPMWRVIVLKHAGSGSVSASCSLIMSFHHLIADGIGAIAVARAFLDESNRVFDSTKNGPQSALQQKRYQLAPPMEDVMDTVPTLRHLLIPVLFDRFPCLTRYFKPPHWRGLAEHKTESANVGKRRSQMALCSIALDGQKLYETCQKMNVTVNSLAVATLCKAIARTICDEKENAMSASVRRISDDSFSVRFKVQVAKNERSRCDISPGDLGVYLSGPQVYVSATNTGDRSSSRFEELKSIATSFQKKLRSSSRGAAMDIGLCCFIREDWMDFARRLATQVPDGIHDSLEFSNIGKIPWDDSCSSRSLKVNGFWFAQGRRETGAAITAAMARNGADGSDIRAVLSSFPQAVPRSTLERIAQTWPHEMESVIGDSNK